MSLTDIKCNVNERAIRWRNEEQFRNLLANHSEEAMMALLEEKHKIGEGFGLPEKTNTGIIEYNTPYPCLSGKIEDLNYLTPETPKEGYLNKKLLLLKEM